MRLLATAVLLIAASGQSSALEISNFWSGLACTNTTPRDDVTGWICHVTEDILVTDQGQCHYSGEDKMCTWVGFEFDYRGAKPGDELACFVEQTLPTAFGNPAEELTPTATTQQFVLPLDGDEGHFYNPQYFTFVTRRIDDPVLESKGRCSFDGEIMFEYTYRVRFPSLPGQGSGPGAN